MTVRDLVMCGTSLEGMEIIVREEGLRRWIYGYRISKKARLYPVDIVAERREWLNLEEKDRHGVDVPEGEVIDVEKGYSLPMKVMCIDPVKAPNEVMDLEVSHYLPRNIPSIHGDKLFNNDFSLEIWCYPPARVEKLAEVVTKDEPKEIEGQTNLLDWLGGADE